MQIYKSFLLTINFTTGIATGFAVSMSKEVTFFYVHTLYFHTVPSFPILYIIRSPFFCSAIGTYVHTYMTVRMIFAGFKNTNIPNFTTNRFLIQIHWGFQNFIGYIGPKFNGGVHPPVNNDCLSCAGEFR